jgi:hypothetical protein
MEYEIHTAQYIQESFKNISLQDLNIKKSRFLHIDITVYNRVIIDF